MSRISMCTLALVCTVAIGPNSGVAADRYGIAGEVSEGVTPAGYDHGEAMSELADTSERYSSGIERWRSGIKDCVRSTRLRGYKRLQTKHRRLLYPQCPPYCSPTFGYHHTQWKPFPEQCEYVFSNVPEQILYPIPAAPSAIELQTPIPEPNAPAFDPTPAPPAAEPYYPEGAPLIFPEETAPPAPEQ